MKIEEVKTLLQQKVIFLEQQYTAAQLRGDIEAVVRLEAEIAETKNTLNRMTGL